MTGARFFPDAEVNLAENLLRATGDGEAVVETDEAGNRAALTADELRAEVARVAAGLREAGVGPGDRVGTVLPNRIPALVSLLATAAVGGVWTSCSPDFGTEGILDRIGQVRPKVLIAEPRYRYGGKAHDISERITEVAARMPELHKVVVIGGGDVSARVAVESWRDFGAPSELSFTRVPFDAPVYILYTSGTTGAPKAIVHRTGGVLLQQLKEHMLHGDVRRGDRTMWYTNTAWMMYHWIVATLGREATLVLYDGAPILKGADGLDGTPLWRVAEGERLTHLGVSPKYMATLADAGFVPKAGRDLGALRWLMSAGSPVAPQQVDWIYANIGDHLGFASISGGTELLGCFLLGAPTRPVRRGTLTAKGLGMAVNVLDERGAPVIGRAGELVCTEPFPSMPLTFWGEDGDRRYRDTYFSTFTEIWAHGDHATLNVDGTAVIHGRSDTTLNPGGVRIGTADIYNVCDRFAEIEDCIVFGRPVPGDEEIVLCVKPNAGAAVDGDLAKRLRSEIRAECSPRHVPSAIYEVTDIPYTLNGKRVEKAAQALATGGEVKNKGAIANLESLEAFARLSEATPL
jgi:acetoacetyl-CoA synthetase